MNKKLGAHIEFRQVSLRAPVGLNYLLSDLSFEVAAGSFVAVVGPSGSGKTSLLRLLNRLIDPSDGHILVNGQDILATPVIAHRQQVGLVLQESKLLGMSVEAALCYPLQLRGLSLAEAQKRIKPWLERLSIPTDWLRRSETELSLGQRQRVAIARALIPEPKILLLDEPTAAQDIGYAEQLLRQLEHLSQTQGLTILMANHDLSLLASAATQVIHLQDGRLVSDNVSSQVDWQALRQKIIEANEQATAEWT